VTGTPSTRANDRAGKRFLVLGGPGGYLTCVAASNAALRARYATWTLLATVHRPLTMARASCAKGWALGMLHRGAFSLVRSSR
jgi:hypothetical protein